MAKTQFFVELKEDINEQDFSNLRLLYSSIVGCKAIMLFQLLFDYFKLNQYRSSFYALAEIQKILNLSVIEIEKARMKLEAVGLMRSFEKADNISFIFKLNKPLSPPWFRSNKLLFKNAIAQIGEIIFERIEFSQKNKAIQKDDYHEITTKYQDLFEMHASQHEVTSTIEIAIPTVKSKEEAVAGLTFSQFVFYLTEAKISPSQLYIFQNLLNQGFSSKSLNLIIDYSFTRNNRIVSNHIKKIAEDLLSKEIKDSHSVAIELQMALANRANKLKEAPLYKSENTQEKEQDWNDLFESLGGF